MQVGFACLLSNRTKRNRLDEKQNELNSLLEIKIKEAMHANSPQVVTITQDIPVLIFYITALATETSTSFYPDIYDHDKTLKSALAKRSQTLANRQLLPSPNTPGINMHKIRAGVMTDTATRQTDRRSVNIF